MFRTVRVWRVALACAVALVASLAFASVASATLASDSFTWLNTSLLVPDDTPPLGAQGDISGGWAVYSTATDPATSRLHARNLETSATLEVPGPGSQRNPQVDLSTLVFDQVDGDDHALVVYDLETQSVTEAATSVADMYPSVSETVVTFLMTAPTATGVGALRSTADVFVYNTAWRQTEQITHTANVLAAKVWGPYIAYAPSSATGSSVRLYDLRDDSDIEIQAELPSLIREIDFDDGIITYSSGDGIADRDVYAYDVDTGERIDVATTESDEHAPYVCGSQIVYTSISTDPIPVLTARIFDMGSRRSVDVSAERGWIVGADERNFLFRDDGAGNGLFLCTPNRPHFDTWEYFSGAYGGTAHLDGMVTDRSIGLANRTLRIQRSYDLIDWVDVGTTPTESWGVFSMQTGPMTRLTYYRLVIDGEFVSLPAHLSNTGGVCYFIPRARLGTPSSSSRLKAYRWYTITGSISPSQFEQGAVGYLQAYRKVNGRWRGPSRFPLSFPSGKYSARAKFTARGSWRIRAHFYGSEINDGAYGSFRYITVY